MTVGMNDETSIDGPYLSGGHWCWRASRGGVEARFLGKGPQASDRERIVAAGAPEAPEIAWLEQLHSDRALAAAVGRCGEGDALVTRGPGLAVSVVTADCVPVLFAGRETVGAIHAGWRGLAAGVIGRALELAAEAPEEITAWIGPTIGGCCYEVSEEVAGRVAAASGDEVVWPGAGERPHLDLPGAAARQLRAAGVAAVEVLPRCTRCDEVRLWSYRREGAGAGRNVAVAWRRSSELVRSSG